MPSSGQSTLPRQNIELQRRCKYRIERSTERSEHAINIVPTREILEGPGDAAGVGKVLHVATLDLLL